MNETTITINPDGTTSYEETYDDSGFLTIENASPEMLKISLINHRKLREALLEMDKNTDRFKDAIKEHEDRLIELGEEIPE